MTKSGHPMLGRNTKAACHFTRTLQEALRPVCSPWYPEGSTQAPTQGAYYGVTLCTQRTGDSTDASVLPWPFKHPRHSASGTNTHTEKAIRFVLLQTGRGGSGNGMKAVKRHNMPSTYYNWKLVSFDCLHPISASSTPSLK